MRRLRQIAIVVSWLALVALSGYELVQKSPASPLGPLPGHEMARRADRMVRWRSATGIAPVDRLLHESQEACLYYRGLATGSLGQ